MRSAAKKAQAGESSPRNGARRGGLRPKPPLPADPAPPRRNRLYVVRKSGIHGRGVFALARLAKGSCIIEYKGRRASWEEATARADSDPRNPAHTFLFGLDDGRVIDPRFGGNAARWINHSCDPNCEAFEDGARRIFLETLRRILPGEELTYDYRLTVDGPVSKRERAQYVCRCGARQCRGSLLRASADDAPLKRR
ncbi:MAG TPA: SET domain-containing protein-lysine N-methyltransferase [Casimicrobiaceae bacterium]|nr:SET domain-containing protein-lysine N-methyltransferase [Casimicrobiaceae bacterium]